jgi:hypothetical protein
MNFYGKAVGPQHTIYGRVVPMMGAIWAAINRAAEQPMPALKLMHEVPPWVHRIADELTRTVFKGVGNLATAAKKYHARKNGQLVGLLLRMAIFYWKGAAAIWEREGLNRLTPEQKARLEEITGWEPACRHATGMAGRLIATKAQLLKFWKQRLGRLVLRLGKMTWMIVNYTLHQSVEDVFQFISGVPEGFQCFLNTKDEYAKTGKRTEVYFALLSYWPEIQEMQQAQPPLSRSYLLGWLEKQEGRQLVESEKAFLELCDDIDLDMAPPGHPSQRNES